MPKHDRLFVAVLGNRNSGKSTTWNTLFGRTVRTGSKESRPLGLTAHRQTDVFLVSGSFEERGLYAGDVLANIDARIVLCSMQYHSDVRDTLAYVREQGFHFYVQWLNPGYSDAARYPDELNLLGTILDNGATLSLRSGKGDPAARVQELRETIYGWARFRNLLRPIE